MLAWMLNFFTEQASALDALLRLESRTVLAAITAFFIMLCTGSGFISWLSRHQFKQSPRDDNPKSHQQKNGTPTMGGILILLVLSLVVLLWADLNNRYVWTALTVTLAYGVIGLIDDYLKIVRQNARGLVAKWKYFWQSVIAVVAAIYLYSSTENAAELQLIVPFLRDATIALGPTYIVLFYFVLVGSSNAVNLTDGLDGLAIFPVAMVAFALGMLAYCVGSPELANLIRVPYLANVTELTVFCSALFGTGLGFLWFNTYPAAVFMGDVGSLALGAALGVVAMMIRHELFFFVMAGLFVAETISVLSQVGFYKMTGRRIFRMAPLHHHFELAGWPETQVVTRLWIASLVLTLFGLALAVLS